MLNFFLLLNLLNVNAGILKQPVRKAPVVKIPIIYHPSYDIGFFGLEKLHPFDSKKYGKVFNFLKNKYKFADDQIYKPDLVSEKDLLLVHSVDYLRKLEQSNYVSQIAEMGALSYMPNFLLQRNLLDPMKYATQGTVLGAELALKSGWAINLSGGYHHAKANSGEGFCFFADIPLAAYKLWQQPKYKNLKILIVDLDAHQGNGHESIFKDNPKIAVLDVYNRQIYPNDMQARKYIKYDYPVISNIKDKEYLELVKNGLEKAINTEKPELIIYNAGTDIFEKDPLGKMKISKKGIIERDFMVFKMAIERKIPILMVLSGGYTLESALIISESIESVIEGILKKNNLFKV